MQIRERIKLSAKPESEFEKHLEEELASYTFDLSRLLNAGLKFADNFNAQIKNYTSNAIADTEDTVAHTLKRVPSGLIVLYQDKAGTIYQTPTSGTDWTATNIYLKCNVASVAFRIMIF